MIFLSAVFAFGVLRGAAFAAEKSAAPLPADHAERMARGLKNFQERVRPLLAERCVKCHGGEKTKGDLDLVTREGLLKGGAEGPVVKAFSAQESRLVRLISHSEKPFMPEKAEKLSAEEIARVAAWIDDGAPYDVPLIAGRKPAKDRSIVTEEDKSWWAFRPLAKGAPPTARGALPADASAIDRFLVEKAAAKNLSLKPAADRRTLIRRALLDLHGIPPTPEEVERFVNDKSPDAWRRLVDGLLESPRFGERWARHWLDVARFAESSGFEHEIGRAHV